MFGKSGKIPRSDVLAVVGALGGLLLAGYVVLKLAPDWFAETKRLDPKARAEARQGVRIASLALLAGTIAAVGAVYTARTFALSRSGQLTDRFSKAIEQLGHEQVDVRLGGIYALERIARDSPEDHPQVQEVLAAYVRDRAPRSDADERHDPAAADPDEGRSQRSDTPTASSPTPATDIQAVVAVLGRRDVRPDELRLDLSATDLRGGKFAAGENGDFRRANLHAALLQQARLDGTRLEGADLSRADLSGADLSAAILFGADLTGGDLSGADLSEAILRGAILFGADLSGADLGGAILSEADLTGADVSGADLSVAILRRANLTGADVSGADLSAAILFGADLTGADLSGADLSAAILHEAILFGADLSGADLTGASCDAATVWPDGFDPAARGVSKKPPHSA